jgi:hypothetical protein
MQYFILAKINIIPSSGFSFLGSKVDAIFFIWNIEKRYKDKCDFLYRDLKKFC